VPPRWHETNNLRVLEVDLFAKEAVLEELANLGAKAANCAGRP